MKTQETNKKAEEEERIKKAKAKELVVEGVIFVCKKLVYPHFYKILSRKNNFVIVQEIGTTTEWIARNDSKRLPNEKEIIGKPFRKMISEDGYIKTNNNFWMTLWNKEVIECNDLD
jgi:hypothetical protein